MPIEQRKIPPINCTKQLPAILLALEYQLEQIRLQQLAKNRSMIQSLKCEEQQHVERLTSAIAHKIVQEISDGLTCSVARGDAKKMDEIISRMFGLG